MKFLSENFQFEPDNRDPSMAQLEKKIQERAMEGLEDPEFRLDGPWKKLIEKSSGVKIYQVDSEWVRNNLLAGWNHGGHGFVCEFIPVDEIWVGTTHPEDCACKGVDEMRRISERYLKSLILHESTERKLMAEGMVYWKAHQLANKAEEKAGFIPDTETEDYNFLLPEK